METPQTFKGKGVLKWALTVGIVIVLNLFFAVAIQTVYPEPKYDDFCEPKQTRELITDEAACLNVGGQWNPTVPTMPARAGEAEGYCFEDFLCSKEFDSARVGYAQNVFVALIVLGALALLGGYVARSAPAVSAGLSYGGVLTFIIASIRYWEAAGDLVRLAIVALALIVLIIVGMKKFKE